VDGVLNMLIIISKSIDLYWRTNSFNGGINWNNINSLVNILLYWCRASIL